MLKIGEFSRLSQVTVKTLHHYDEIGLLKPSQVDRFTNYRYYTLDQLPRIHSIMALKELGLSLEEIAQLLLEDLPPEQIRGMLRLKQAEGQQRVREEQARLAQIEFRLRQIERDGMMQTVDIVIKRIEPFYAMAQRHQKQTWQERKRIGDAIHDALERGLIKPIGSTPANPMGSFPLANIFYEAEFQGEYSDTEVVITVEATHPPVVPVGDAGTFTLREIPAIEAAATYMHQGDYGSLNEKYVFLQRWALENGYKLSGTWRFLYHRGPMHPVDPSGYLFELQHPIERA
jgi:DNA-binding transcriptional MerR regulator/effector-binding domain-containing protein